MKEYNSEGFKVADHQVAAVDAARSSMQTTEPPKSDKPQPTTRVLKIEATGDIWRGLIKPRIRLMGYWLEQAGFKPGRRVQVKCIAPGVIELHSPDEPVK